MSIDLEALRQILIWSLIVNSVALLLWFALVTLTRDWVYRLSCRWFPVSTETFDAVNYGGIALYKIGILLFNVAPLVGVLVAT